MAGNLKNNTPSHPSLEQVVRVNERELPGKKVMTSPSCGFLMFVFLPHFHFHRLTQQLAGCKSLILSFLSHFHETFVFLSLLLVFPSIKIYELPQLQSHTFPVEKLLWTIWSLLHWQWLWLWQINDILIFTFLDVPYFVVRAGPYHPNGDLEWVDPLFRSPLRHPAVWSASQEYISLRKTVPKVAGLCET